MTVGFNLNTSYYTSITPTSYVTVKNANPNYANNMALMNMLAMPGVGAGDSAQYCMDYNMLGYGCYYPSIYTSPYSYPSWYDIGNNLGNALALPFNKLGNAICNLFS